jgi:hypothetical protein
VVEQELPMKHSLELFPPALMNTFALDRTKLLLTWKEIETVLEPPAQPPIPPL